MSGRSVLLPPVINSCGPPSEWLPPKTRIGTQVSPDQRGGAGKSDTDKPRLTHPFCGPWYMFSTRVDTMADLEPSVISTTPGKASALKLVWTGQEMTHGSGSALSTDYTHTDERRPVVTPFE